MKPLSGCFLIPFLLSSAAIAQDLAGSVELAISGSSTSNGNPLQAESNMIINAQVDAKEIRDFLPEPLVGWTRQDLDDQPSGGQSTGTVYSARYEKDGKYIDVLIVSDTEAVKAMAMLFSPEMVPVAGELKSINGEEVLVDRHGGLMVPLTDEIIVRVAGSARADEAEAYFKSLDIEGLKGL